MRLRLLWPAFLASFRLSERAICEMSALVPPGEPDFHDYPDSTLAAPFHFVGHRCRRCGKDFTI